ncbi:hypothetical protein [Haloarchaeobius sp. DT45]|uniref:hypothetical protein n=1 Tax=Haloarchaeobius sp. DT45 TaxID=3446116 RepID=UPI003F6D76EA
MLLPNLHKTLDTIGRESYQMTTSRRSLLATAGTTISLVAGCQSRPSDPPSVVLFNETDTTQTIAAEVADADTAEVVLDERVTVDSYESTSYDLKSGSYDIVARVSETEGTYEWEANPNYILSVDVTDEGIEFSEGVP